MQEWEPEQEVSRMHMLHTIAFPGSATLPPSMGPDMQGLNPDLMGASGMAMGGPGIGTTQPIELNAAATPGPCQWG